jgi:DNA repair protein RecO (recombination protein O)
LERTRLYRTEAVVIKRLNYGEADKILTLYTPQFGKIRAIAKGVRRLTSRFGGNMELLTHTKLMLAKGRNLDIVTQCESINSFEHIREDLNRISQSYYIIELLDRSTEDESENQPLFNLLVETLGLMAGDCDPEIAVRRYEILLLEQLGYRPQLMECAHCRKTLEQEVNYFSPEAGGMLCPACGSGRGRPVSVNALKVLRAFQRDRSARPARLKLPKSVKAEMESILRSHTQHYFERELKSTSFINELRQTYRVDTDGEDS